MKLVFIVYCIWHFALVLLLYVHKLLFSGIIYRVRDVLFRPPSIRPKLVIVGGGFAGSYAARNLEREFDVSLVDCKEYFEFTPSVLRTIVDPPYLRNIQLRHDKYLYQTRIFTQGASRIDFSSRKVILRNSGGVVPYDYLLIASGSSYAQPIKPESGIQHTWYHNVVVADRADVLVAHAHRVHKARSINIIGGGTVGTELAAELIEAYPKKRIELITSTAHLLPRMPPHSQQYAERWLKRHGVKLTFEKRVDIRKAAEEADLIFLCTGVVPNSDLLLSPQPASDKAAISPTNFLDTNSYIKVEQTLQLAGHPEVFVAGDIASLPEEKLAQSAEASAKVAVRNLRKCVQLKVKGQTKEVKSEQLASYRPIHRPMVISLGRTDGLFVWGKFSIGGLIPGLLKEAVEWKVLVNFKNR